MNQIIPALYPLTLLLIWFFLGWALLSYCKIEDSILKGLLSPSLGLAIIIVVEVGFSLLGWNVPRIFWIILTLGLILLILSRQNFRNGLMLPVYIIGFVFILNLLTIAFGLLKFGFQWHAMLNQDGATNSMAAFYFLKHTFFQNPEIINVLQGTDFSTLSSRLYVAGGHRFGDVMLLSFSSKLFGINPDQIYMSHALALRCSLVSIVPLLLFRKGMPKWQLFVPIILFTFSTLFTYAFLVQLISQMGGQVLLIGILVLSSLLYQSRELINKLLIPIAIEVAALAEAYPEILTLLALTVFILFFFEKAKNKELTFKKLIIWALIIASLVLLIVNYSFLNIVSHLIAVAGWGVQTLSVTDPVNTNFGYAYTPDFLMLLFGFSVFQEVLPYGWAITAFVMSIALLVALIVFSIKYASKFSLLISVCFSTTLAFAVLYHQLNGFGTFKIMMVSQPFIFALISAFIIQLASIKFVLGFIVFALFVTANIRSSNIFVSQTIYPTTFFETIQSLVKKNVNGSVFVSSSFLTGTFVALRAKSSPIYFEQNLLQYYAGATDEPKDENFYKAGNRWDDLKKKILPNQGGYEKELNKFYKTHYKKSEFNCGPDNLKVEFEYLIHSALSGGANYIVPGGRSISLNRNKYENIEFASLGIKEDSDFLIFRPSSVGEFYGITDDVGIFDSEGDPMRPLRMSGVGRYVLLEILSTPGKPLRLDFNYSRTYMTKESKQISEITIYGKSPVKLGAVGSGSLSLVSPKINPCVIDSRNFILVDFGVKAGKRIDLVPTPYAYKLLNIPYVPDKRNLVGFLRDLSVYKEGDVALNKTFTSLNNWDFNTFQNNFEYSGIYEDGWMSSKALIRLKRNDLGKRIFITFDIPGIKAKEGARMVITSGDKVQVVPLDKQGLLQVPLDLNRLTNTQYIFRLEDSQNLMPIDGREVIGKIVSIRIE